MSSKKEIAFNVKRWSEAMSQQLPKDIGFALSFFPKDGSGAAFMGANVPEERLKKIITSLYERYNDTPRIITLH